MTATTPHQGRRPGAEDLFDRLRLVWPDRGQLAVRYRQTRSRASSPSYLILPSLGHASLLVPADDRAAALAIARVDEGQRLASLTRVLAGAHRRGVLRRLPLPRLVIADGADSPLLADIQRLVPETRSLVIRLGRPRSGRAIVFQSLDASGRSVAFAKATSGRQRRNLEIEHANLVEVNGDGITGLRAPRPLGFAQAEDYAVLAISSLVHAATDSADKAEGIPLDAMRSLANWRGSATLSFAGTPVAHRLAAGIDDLQDPESRAWLRDSLAGTLRTFGGLDVSTATWHGDWVPWNMARAGSTVLLWDWEHYEHGVLAGFDHLHYLAQDLRGRKGTTKEVEDEWLGLARSALADEWATSGPVAELVIRAYLLVANLRYVLDRDNDGSGSPRRAGWSRSLLQRLDAGAV